MYAQLAMTIIALLWSGMILGISFLESWVKFRARSLTKPVALDVGRTVFNAFHKVQYFLLIVLIVLGLIARIYLQEWVILILLTIIIALQGFWFFPLLSKRVDQIFMGDETSKSKIHSLYGVLEIIKLGLLLYFSLSYISV